MRMKKIPLYLLFIGLFLVQSVIGQYNIPDKPKKQTSVYDYIELLSANQKKTLERKLVRYSDSTSTQIVVAIINSTNGESIGVLAPRWGHKWGVGQKKEDNGVFILLAKDDRKIWISPGYGVEHLLTAGVTGELTREIIIPEFKKNNYYKGLDKGSDAIFEVLNGSYKGARKNKKGSGTGIFRLFPILFFIVLFIILSNRNNRGGRGGRRRSNFSLLDAIILSNAGRGFGGSGGSFGGSSGGFGGGFGGGGFSGGGAGGSW
ncbi:MAG: TPM domain-containing protein [Flavobacteriaceae bacterium]|nr:TPM domain-containing protein [Flavobacteriaceae bacterium]